MMLQSVMLPSVAAAAIGARCLLAVLLSLLLLTVDATAQKPAEHAPARMRVLYEVNFNGFVVGSFAFDAQAAGESYSLAGSARLSVLLGVLSWEGETRSFGMLAKEATRPATFSFDFKSGLAAGSTTLAFADDAVSSITQLPPAAVDPSAIPLREDHLKGVVDPLTALMVLSRASSSNPCQRRIAIFDGRERFDLLFSYKGQMPVTEQPASGQPSVALLCRVRYLPIAGHKVDPETQFMAANEAIEVALRPIPAANLFVPYHITVPTRLGTASLIAKRVEIASPGKPQIALLH
jgi:hypothetical protein